MSSSKATLKFAQYILIAILCGLTAAGAYNVWEAPFRDGLTFQSILGSLGALFVIVLLVERATEILIAVWRAPKAEKMKRECEALSAGSEEEIAKRKEFKEFKAGTKGVALMIGFTLSIIVCVAGVGLLTDLMDVQALGEEWQKYILRGMDILLTASLIAGGSDAFHQFTSALETFFKKTKESMSGES